MSLKHHQREQWSAVSPAQSFSPCPSLCRYTPVMTDWFTLQTYDSKNTKETLVFSYHCSYGYPRVKQTKVVYCVIILKEAVATFILKKKKSPLNPWIRSEHKRKVDIDSLVKPLLSGCRKEHSLNVPTDRLSLSFFNINFHSYFNGRHITNLSWVHLQSQLQFQGSVHFNARL